MTDFNEIYETFQQTYNEMIELSTISVKKTKRNTEHEWITNDIRNACIERDRLYKKFKNNRRNQEYEKEFKKFRNELNRRINQTKSGYYKEKFYEAKSNPKETWKLVNTILGTKSNNLDEDISKNFVNTENFEDLANQFANQIS